MNKSEITKDTARRFRCLTANVGDERNVKALMVLVDVLEAKAAKGDREPTRDETQAERSQPVRPQGASLGGR